MAARHFLLVVLVSVALSDVRSMATSKQDSGRDAPNERASNYLNELEDNFLEDADQPILDEASDEEAYSFRSRKADPWSLTPSTVQCSSK